MSYYGFEDGHCWALWCDDTKGRTLGGDFFCFDSYGVLAELDQAIKGAHGISAVYGGSCYFEASVDAVRELGCIEHSGGGEEDYIAARAEVTRQGAADDFGVVFSRAALDRGH